MTTEVAALILAALSMLVTIIGWVYSASQQKKLADRQGEIQKTVSEHQIRFTQSFQNQGRVIEGLFKQIVQLQQIFESATDPLEIHGYEGQPKDEQLQQGFKAANEFIAYYHQNSLYLDEETCRLLDTFIGKLRAMNTDDMLVNHLKPHQGVGDTNLSIWFHEQDMRKIVREDLPTIKAEIAKRMQTTLGINSPHRPDET